MPGAGLTSDRLKVFVPPTESAAILPINVKDPAYGAVGDGTTDDTTATFTSATATFSSSDVGKMILVTGAGSAGGLLTTYISAFTNSTTVTLGNNASTSVSGATFRYGFNDVGIELGAVLSSRMTAHGNVVRGGNSGVIAEGGSDGSSTYLAIIGNHVDGSSNVGLGFSEAGGGNTLKHELGVCQGNTTYNCNTGIAVAGNGLLVTGNVVDQFLTDGILVGGNDYDEAGSVISANFVKAAATATGYCVNVVKTGTFTNFLRALKISGNHLDGNAQALNCVRLAGKLKNVSVTDNAIQKAKNAGVLYVADNSVSPKDSRLIGNDIRNNNQSANSAGVSSVGVGLSAGDTFLIEGNRITDDQGSPTQTHAFHWTSGVVKVGFQQWLHSRERQTLLDRIQAPEKVISERISPPSCRCRRRSTPTPTTNTGSRRAWRWRT
jgi:hypothetical protein